MQHTATPADVVCALTAGVGRLVTGRLAPDERETLLDQLAGLYARHTDVRHPFRALGDTPLRTREELREHFANGPGQAESVETFEPVGTLVHQTADPEVVIVEFSYAGTVNGRPFDLPCIFVVRVRDGVIVESRDYSHDVAFARAFGGLGDLAAALAEDTNEPG